MILIADSGATKADWYLTPEDDPRSGQLFTTQGITPVHQSEEVIHAILREELLPQLNGKTVSAIYFYGAGCSPQRIPAVRDILSAEFPSATTIEVANDMLGAARALCGNRSGIVCILGTGSNSCYYDGDTIVSNVPSLGYILGDEGSGAYLGKRLVGDCLKGQLSESVCRRFMDRFQLTPEDVIEKVYRQPLPNRFLASLSRFLGENREEPEIHNLLVDCFSKFVQRNLLRYPAAKLYCTGSVAYYYAAELAEATEAFGLQIERIIQKPMEGLIAYHTPHKP